MLPLRRGLGSSLPSLCTTLLFAYVAIALCPRASGEEPSFETARQLELTGKYAEGEELYAKLGSENAEAAALGVARCLSAIGESERAIRLLEQAVSKSKEQAASAGVAALLSGLYFLRGDYDAASRWGNQALEVDAKHLAARWIRAELHRTAGQIAEADREYEQIVEYYNANDLDDPDQLRAVGLAAAQFARWRRLPEQFRVLVNDLYRSALDVEPNYWPAHYESARLFLEKYNQAEAARQLAAAEAINLHAAEIHTACAALHLQNYDLDEARSAIDRALECNPECLEARMLAADLEMANFEAAAALAILEQARPLNPASEELHGRIAAAYVVLDGYQPENGASRLAKLIDEVSGRNPHCGRFFYTLGVRLEERRQFEAAERAFRDATDRLPEFIGPRGALGMMYMRLGREDDARRLLTEAFELDPFHVRVRNTLEVLDVLADYAALETEHFLIRYDVQQDALLARYMADYLEEIFPQLCETLGYTPPDKTLFEIFSTARNTNGHGWFSARMVGLPYVGTVGACAGTMVALASPNDVRQPFNWARVVKHEFVHVVNLQQTGFSVPHWFTEALAVWNEGYPRSQSWNELLGRRVPAGDVFTLDDLNLGFIRPQSSEDWQMAYCQAELYAEYMLARFGDDAFARLLAAFAKHPATPAAVEAAFDVPLDDFEHGYTEYLREVAAPLSAAGGVARTSEELRDALASNPDDPDALAELAMVHLARRAYPEARRMVDRAFEQAPQHQLASYVRARLHLVVGEGADALALLAAHLDRESPDERCLALLAALRLKSGAADKAAELYALGYERQPWNIKWLQGLVRAHLATGNDRQLEDALEQLAAHDADDVAVRIKLAQLARDRDDATGTIRWARAAMQIDVTISEPHELAAAACLQLQDYVGAAEELVALVELAAENPELRDKVAELIAATGEPDSLHEALETLAARGSEYRRGAQIVLDLIP